MKQLTNAFTFQLAGERMESEVLPGMEGELWIDKETLQWVQVRAKIIKSLTIAGFLAQVETYFDDRNQVSP